MRAARICPRDICNAHVVWTKMSKTGENNIFKFVAIKETRSFSFTRFAIFNVYRVGDSTIFRQKCMRTMFSN